MGVDLFYKTIGQGPPLFILHGLFGSSDNWQSIANKLKHNFTVYLIDLRNHGESPHTTEHNYSEMAKDLLKLCIKDNLEKVSIIGHSMGGKAAMKFAVTNPTFVNKLVVVDIAPKQYPMHHQQILKAFNSVDIYNISSRKEADFQMSEIVSEVMVRQFLLKNLKRNTDNTFGWKINLSVLQNEISNIGEALLQHEKCDNETLFISGQKSGYIVKDDEDLIHHHFPNSNLEYLDCGHWVHAEKPVELLKLINDFIS